MVLPAAASAKRCPLAQYCEPIQRVLSSAKSIFAVGAVRDGDRRGRNHRGQWDHGHGAGEETGRLQLLSGGVEEGAVRDQVSHTAGDGYRLGYNGGVCCRGGVEVVQQRGLGDDADACAAIAAAAALRAAVEDVYVGAVEREVSAVGPVKGSGNGNHAIDRKNVGFAVDGARRGDGGGRGVELDDAIQGVGVPNHCQRDSVAGVDGDLVDVGQIERVIGAGLIIDDSDLAGALDCGEDADEVGRERDGVDRAGEAAGAAARGFGGVVDNIQRIRRNVGVDVAAKLPRGS